MPPTRGRILRTVVRGGRLLADVQMMNGQLRTRVEVLQPYGMSGVPMPGAEMMIHAAAGAPDQLVAMSGDAGGLRAPGLQPGEMALQDMRGATLRFTGAGLLLDAAGQAVTVKAATQVIVDAPVVKLGGAGATQPVKLANGANATKVFAE